jgi:hypothetical protein
VFFMLCRVVEISRIYFLWKKIDDFRSICKMNVKFLVLRTGFINSLQIDRNFCVLSPLHRRSSEPHDTFFFVCLIFVYLFFCLFFCFFVCLFLFFFCFFCLFFFPVIFFSRSFVSVQCPSAYGVSG